MQREAAGPSFSFPAFGTTGGRRQVVACIAAGIDRKNGCPAKGFGNPGLAMV
jgi:hypothetical protein